MSFILVNYSNKSLLNSKFSNNSDNFGKNTNFVENNKKLTLMTDTVSFTSLSKLPDRADCAYCHGLMLSEEQIADRIDKLFKEKGKALQLKLNEMIMDLTSSPVKNSKLAKDKLNSILKRRIKCIEKLLRLIPSNDKMSLSELVELLKSKKTLSPRLLNGKEPKKIFEYLYFPMLKSEDHIIPKIRGGSNSASNRVYVCQGCNSHKSDKTLEEFEALYPEIKF